EYKRMRDADPASALGTTSVSVPSALCFSPDPSQTTRPAASTSSTSNAAPGLRCDVFSTNTTCRAPAGTGGCAGRAPDLDSESHVNHRQHRGDRVRGDESPSRPCGS